MWRGEDGLRQRGLAWLEFHTLHRPNLLFPENAWRQLEREAFDAGLARERLVKLFLKNCEFSGWHRGGVVLDRFFVQTCRLDLLGLHHLAHLLYPTLERVRVIELHYASASGNNSTGTTRAATIAKTEAATVQSATHGAQADSEKKVGRVPPARIDTSNATSSGQPGNPSELASPKSAVSRGSEKSRSSGSGARRQLKARMSLSAFQERSGKHKRKSMVSGKLKEAVVRPSAPMPPGDPRGEKFIVSQGFSAELVDREDPLPLDEDIMIAHNGFKEDERQVVRFAGFASEPTLVARYAAQESDQQIFNCSREIANDGVQKAQEKIEKEQRSTSFLSFTRWVLQFCTMGAAALRQFAIKALYTARDPHLFVQQIHGHTATPRDLRLLQLLVQRRFEADGNGQTEESKMSSFCDRYPVILAPLFLMQEQVRRVVFGKAAMAAGLSTTSAIGTTIRGKALRLGQTSLASIRNRLESSSKQQQLPQPYHQQQEKQRKSRQGSRNGLNIAWISTARELISVKLHGQVHEVVASSKSNALVKHRLKRMETARSLHKAMLKAEKLLGQNPLEEGFEDHAGLQVRTCRGCRQKTPNRPTSYCESCEGIALRLLADEGGYWYAQAIMSKAEQRDKFEATDHYKRDIWVEEFDKKDRRSFFFNVATGHSSWTEPEPPDRPERQIVYYLTESGLAQARARKFTEWTPVARSTERRRRPRRRQGDQVPETET